MYIYIYVCVFSTRFKQWKSSQLWVIFSWAFPDGFLLGPILRNPWETPPIFSMLIVDAILWMPSCGS